MTFQVLPFHRSVNVAKGPAVAVFRAVMPTAMQLVVLVHDTAARSTWGRFGPMFTMMVQFLPSQRSAQTRSPEKRYGGGADWEVQ